MKDVNTLIYYISSYKYLYTYMISLFREMIIFLFIHKNFKVILKADAEDINAKIRSLV